MMGGSGLRFGGSRPKQYMLFRNRPVFSYILEEYARMEAIGRIIVVSNGAWMEETRKWCDRFGCGKVHAVARGGATRSESVKNGLLAAADIAREDSVVLIHDATHPYVDREGTLKVLEAARRCGGATLGAFSYDTVYELDEEQKVKAVLPRARVISGASPEAFLFGKIYPVYQKASPEELAAMTSAGAIALQNNIPMAFVETKLLNLKITHPSDFTLFSLLAQEYFFPTSM